MRPPVCSRLELDRSGNLISIFLDRDRYGLVVKSVFFWREGSNRSDGTRSAIVEAGNRFQNIIW
jgi:hypothetical protein